jgi:hypothetical protein
MISIEFTRTRAQATREAQAILAAAPTNWVWSQKMVPQWDNDIAKLDQLLASESLQRTQWRNAAEDWQVDLNEIQEMTRQVAAIGRVHFRNHDVKRVCFECLRTDGASRAAVYEQGLAARDAWQEADAQWTFAPDVTLAAFSALLSSSLAKQSVHSAKLAAWRNASAAVMEKARNLDRDNIAWFAEATRRFPAGTTEGDMIRSTVPRTTRTETPVGQAVISNLTVNAGTIRFDVSAPGATRYTYLHQAPDSAAFVVVLADSPEASFALSGQPSGLHRFKVVGSNSQGSGPESAVAEISVAQSQAA